MKQLVLVLSVMALAALACGGGGGDKLACLRVEFDLCSNSSVQGTVTNICEETVSGAEIYATIVDGVGNTVERDAEYITSALAPGEHAYLEWVFAENGPANMRCRAEVTKAY